MSQTVVINAEDNKKIVITDDTINKINIQPQGSTAICAPSTGQNPKFITLGDTPKSYRGHSGDILAVKSTEDGVEFVKPIVDQTDNLVYSLIFGA
jgi:hypothetical protein